MVTRTYSVAGVRLLVSQRLWSATATYLIGQEQAQLSDGYWKRYPKLRQVQGMLHYSSTAPLN